MMDYKQCHSITRTRQAKEKMGRFVETIFPKGNLRNLKRKANVKSFLNQCYTGDVNFVCFFYDVNAKFQK